MSFSNNPHMHLNMYLPFFSVFLLKASYFKKIL